MKTQEEVLALLLPIIEKEGSCFRKFLKVKAQPAESGSLVVTKTSDGVETRNKAKNGDWLVENQTEAKERYLIKEAEFSKRYTLEETVDQWGIYQPKGQIIAVRFDEQLLHQKIPKELVFEAPWGEKMRLRQGDYLVCPMDKREIYRIAQKEFSETYASC